MTRTPRRARLFERRKIGRHAGREHDQLGALEDVGRLQR